jgi:hypothetical protein
MVSALKGHARTVFLIGTTTAPFANLERFLLENLMHPENDHARTSLIETTTALPTLENDLLTPFLTLTKIVPYVIRRRILGI